MAFCMDATTGAYRHEEIRDAEYEVDRTESSVTAYWCANCVLDYIACGMGACIISIRLLRPVEDSVDYTRINRELDALGIECKQP